MKPYQVRAQIERLEKNYRDELAALAQEVLEDRIIPYCDEHKLSFTMMNGIPRLVGENGEYVCLPQFMCNFMDIADSNGDHLMWYMDDYKLNRPGILGDLTF